MIQDSPAHLNADWENNQALLSRISRLRQELDEIERTLHERHLSHGVFRGLQGSGEIARAAGQLSTKRIGALIAIERDVTLDDYTHGGTLLNATLSASLLVSIFYPGNPLHDGAVIIRGDSILAAGCVLPLSADHTRFKAKGLGMRHRAGVGLSQVSDALVFIVSEESGAVSMATNGELFPINLQESKRRLELLRRSAPAA